MPESPEKRGRAMAAFRNLLYLNFRVSRWLAGAAGVFFLLYLSLEMNALQETYTPQRVRSSPHIYVVGLFFLQQILWFAKYREGGLRQFAFFLGLCAFLCLAAASLVTCLDPGSLLGAPFAPFFLFFAWLCLSDFAFALFGGRDA